MLEKREGGEGMGGREENRNKRVHSLKKKGKV